MMSDYLADKNEDLDLRKSIASVLGGIGSQEAADFLMWRLAEEKGIAGEIIDALDRIRTADSRIRFPRELIIPKVYEEVQTYCRQWVEAQEGLPGTGEASVRREKGLADSLWNIFKLLGLVYTHEDMIKAYQNLRTGTKDSVAYALELLDNVLEKDIRDAVFPLVEDLQPEERTKRCRHLLATLKVRKDRHG